MKGDFKSRMNELILVTKIIPFDPFTFKNIEFVEVKLHLHEIKGFMLEFVPKRPFAKQFLYRLFVIEDKLVYEEDITFVVTFVDLLHQIVDVPNLISEMRLAYEEKKDEQKLLRKAYDRYKQEKEEKLEGYLSEEINKKR